MTATHVAQPAQSKQEQILAALRNGERLSRDQIVERFGVTSGSVKVLMNFIRARLNPDERIPKIGYGHGHTSGRIYFLEKIAP